MSFKKYTYRNGKRYGPYLYENKRMGDKIVSTYLGHVPTKNYKKYFAFGFLIVLFLVLGVYFVGEIKFGKLFSPPREYSLISLGSLVEGELLIGKIDINLRRGECLPADTEVVASLDNVVEERLLSDVVSENVMECDFYLEETSVSGSGNGFGVEGEKEIFPEINFELMFLKDDADEISSTPLIGGGQSDNQEAAEEVEKAVEEKAIDEETIDETPVEEEEKTVDEEETADETPIEEVVEEERAVDEVEKEVVKEEPKSESGKVEEVGDELVISTDYSIIENGFGEEFLGEEIYNFNFDLREFGFIIGKGLLQVDFEYNGEELFGSEEEILFDSELLADEKNEKAPEIVNDINITLPEINETAIPEVINETNATIPEINITISDKNETNATQIGQARIGLPVKWAIRKKAEIGSNVVDIPESASNVVVSKLDENDGEIERREISEDELETSEDASPALESDEERIVDDKILLAPSSRKKINVDISSDGIVENLIVEYETPAPFIASEELNENGKKIIVSSGVEELHYNDVLVFTNIDENLNVIDKSRVKIFWVENSDGIVPTSVEDKDGNGVYDYIEFIAPHLSNQTFNIIVITKAEHLDNNRSFISDIFEEVRELDGIWSETINDGEYVRVTFEIPLDSSRDITVWPRIVSGNPRIEVYEAEGNEVIAEFTSLNDDEYNKVYLTNLGQGQCYDNETEILTGDGWKYFYELEDEKVATLNSESGKLEWEEPLDKQVFEHDGEMFRIELNSHISEELGFDSNFDGCVEHLFVVCDKNRVCNFGTSDKNSIKTRTHCDRAEVNTLLEHFSIGNNITGEINNKFSNLFSDIFVSSKSGRYTSSLNYSDNRNNNFNFFIVHFINERGSKIVNPELFFGDRVLFSSSWLNESFNDNAGIKDMTHKSYSLSRISLTNSVGSSYDSMSSNNSLISSNDGESLCFFNFNNDMIMCSSLSFFFFFLNHSLSSIENNIGSNYINVSGGELVVSPKHKVYVSINGEDFDLIPIVEVYESINSGKEVYFLDAEGNKIKVNSIIKENYSGKIYDVDVENDIVLVRRIDENDNEKIKRGSNGMEPNRLIPDYNMIINSKYLNVSKNINAKLINKENKGVKNVTPTVRNFSLDDDSNNDNMYINFSDNSNVEDAALIPTVRNRSETSGLFPRQLGSTPGRSASTHYSKSEEIDLGKIDLTKAFWSGNSDGYSQDTFDLKIVGGSVEFEHVVDPIGDSCTTGDECGADICIDENGPVPGGGFCRSDCVGNYGRDCSKDGSLLSTNPGTCSIDAPGFCDYINPVRMDCSLGLAFCEIGTDITYDVCTIDGGDSCDSTAGGDFVQEGICASDGVNPVCDNLGEVAFNDLTYYTTCTDTWQCDFSTTDAGDYFRDGYCCGGCKQDRTVLIGDACCGISEVCETNICGSDNTCKQENGGSCDTGNECGSGICISGTCESTVSSCNNAGNNGLGCSTNGAIWSTSAAGTCVSNAGGMCDYVNPVRMDCSLGFAFCEIGTDITYDACPTTSGDSCDGTAGGNFVQNGICASGGANNCDTSGHVCVNSVGNYESTCGTCYDTATARVCDRTLDNGDFLADGICVSPATCDFDDIARNCKSWQSCSSGSFDYYPDCVGA